MIWGGGNPEWLVPGHARRALGAVYFFPASNEANQPQTRGVLACLSHVILFILKKNNQKHSISMQNTQGTHLNTWIQYRVCPPRGWLYLGDTVEIRCIKKTNTYRAHWGWFSSLDPTWSCIQWVVNGRTWQKETGDGVRATDRGMFPLSRTKFWTPKGGNGDSWC